MTEDQRETIERAIEICNSVQMFATAKGLRDILTIAQPVEQTGESTYEFAVGPSTYEVHGAPDAIKAFQRERKHNQKIVEHALSRVAQPVEQPVQRNTVSDAVKLACESRGVEFDADSAGATLGRLLRWERENIAQPVEQTRALPQSAMPAWRDVVRERRRQIGEEGWTAAHDDEHANGDMAIAAACYAASAGGVPWSDDVPSFWPWADQWWKPTTARRDLVKAGALILAEIERLDRTAAHPASGETET